ncbi:hypothetical protein AB0230_07060 [Microbacterium sp. NPDC089190]|uniref:hypothetical protein n=1 Tax=Microbacterium sp. NPDC089190 TaxID=3155063 RepID=UPI00344E4F4B
MRRLPERMMPHRDLISYKPKKGEGTYGPVYGDEVICKRGAISDKRRYVRDRDGNEVISESRIALDLPDHDVPDGSLVTIWRGTPQERETTAIVTAVADWPRLPHFIEISLA